MRPSARIPVLPDPAPLSLHGIDFKTPFDEDWEDYSVAYNRRIPAMPVIVALPETIQQVSRAVKYAAAYGLKVQARSGGHSYSSASNGGVNGCFVVDLRKFQDIVYQLDGVVRVGGGVRLGKLSQTLFNEHGRALAHGSCPSVGIGGHYTHGGFGYTSRAWGLSTDQIVAMDVVLADGQILRTSPWENTLLYKVMRGAADSFGIVVNFYLRTQPAPESVLAFSIEVPTVMCTVEGAVAAFEHIQSLAHDPTVMESGLGIVIFISHTHFSVNGTFLGTTKRFTSKILPALVGGIPDGENMNFEVSQHSWLALIEKQAGGESLTTTFIHENPSMIYNKSAVIPHPGVARVELEAYFKHILSEGPSCPTSYWIGAQLYGGAHSQITNPPNTSQDSCGRRDAMWVFQHYGSMGTQESSNEDIDGACLCEQTQKMALEEDSQAEFPKEAIRFLEGLNVALGPWHGASDNYPDASLTRENAVRLYYGSKLEFLKGVKGIIDPGDVFSHPQSIQSEARSNIDIRQDRATHPSLIQMTTLSEIGPEHEGTKNTR